MSTTEITNAMYSLFDPAHDSGVIDRAGKDHNDPGEPANRPHRGRSAFRLAYDTWQPVLNVGFRVVIEGKPRNIAGIDNTGPAVASAASGQP